MYSVDIDQYQGSIDLLGAMLLHRMDENCAVKSFQNCIFITVTKRGADMGHPPIEEFQKYLILKYPGLTKKNSQTENPGLLTKSIPLISSIKIIQ